MMQRFFGNSRERLLLSLLGDGEIDSEELSRLKALIAKATDEREVRKTAESAESAEEAL